MAIQKLQGTSRAPAQNNITLTEQHQPLSNTKSHGHMAPSFRRKNLVCFYCNKKSDTKYDGLITRWDCARCESTNFLDENGDITDPPVATESAAPGLLRYTTTHAKSLPQDDSELFCATCMKNQHLYTASLAQYHVETDPTHPRYKELEREYFNYRRSLERRYPQVCEDCEPRVLERMRDAGRTAKADHLRRALDRSRTKRLSKERKLTISGTFEVIGRWLWYIGLIGQLFWSGVAFSIPIIEQNLPEATANALVGRLGVDLQPTHSIARVSLLCSITSIWWNPMFKQMNNGFMNHISGFGDWYKLQVLSIVVRLIFYNMAGTGVFADPFSPATLGANTMVAIFTFMLAIMSHRSLKVDLSPLWANTPEKLTFVGPKSARSPRGLDSMEDVLDQISATPSRRAEKRMSPARTAAPSFDLHITKKPHRSEVAPTFPFAPRKFEPGPGKTSPSLFDMSQEESVRYMATGETPTRLRGDDVEEMEWTPTETQSQYRAFHPQGSTQRTTESFGNAPLVDQPSPFWYKVPPAPVTPAQRLRNPPNRPALRVSSQEAKENFFNRVTQRAPVSDKAPRQSPLSREETSKNEIEFARQKFFPPPAPSEAGNTLADLLTGFSLGGSEGETPVRRVAQRTWKRHLVQSIVMAFGMFLWNHAVYHPSEYSQNAMLVVMLVSIGIGIRSILDNTTPIGERRNPLIPYLGALVGGLECAAAVYGLIEILAERGHSDGCASLGMILTGEIVVRELWIALIGG